MRSKASLCALEYACETDQAKNIGLGEDLGERDVSLGPLYEFSKLNVFDIERKCFTAVIALDWTGPDLSSNPVHPILLEFGSWSSKGIQCKYIL